jgi:hypothetical protein
VPTRPVAEVWIILRWFSAPGPDISSRASGVMMIPGLMAFTRAPRAPQARLSV